MRARPDKTLYIGPSEVFLKGGLVPGGILGVSEPSAVYSHPMFKFIGTANINILYIFVLFGAFPLNLYIHAYIHKYSYIYRCRHLHVYMHVYMCIYICACMCIYTCEPEKGNLAFYGLWPH